MVSNNGNVGIGIADSLTPLSTLSVGCQGHVNRIVSIEATTSSGQILDKCNIYSKLNSIQGPNWHTSIFGQTIGIPNSARIVGVEGRATRTSSSNNGRSYGVLGMAGMSTSGWNYGVIGFLATSNDNGAGVFGGLTQGSEICVNGRYAGFFNGKTKVNGDFYATALNSISDERLKTDIRDVEVEILQRIQSLRPISYRWKQIENTQVKDTTTSKAMYFSEDIEYDRSHYGFLAQDVQKLFPELVHEDNDGYLSVNYVELIPLLVQAVQRLSSEVENLKNINQSSPAYAKVSRNGGRAYASLLQNTPNPFSQVTKIGYYLPEETHEASIHVYDMNGTEIVAFQVDAIGKGELTIDGGALRAGMYLYSLIADGQLIDTKQMILTK